MYSNLVHDNIKILLNRRKAWYKTIGTRFCPALKDYVVFNAKGFNHVLYDGFGKVREPFEQRERLYFLPHIVSIISKAARYKACRRSKRITYWSFSHKISENTAITVIVRKIGLGKPIFYSVWKNNKKSLHWLEGFFIVPIGFNCLQKSFRFYGYI